MRRKQPVPFSERFPKADPAALKLLQRLLSFDPKDRPTAEEVNISNVELKQYYILHFFIQYVEPTIIS
jgi:serine/threonine protein kinase